jgi:hypothetical protein
MEPRLGSAGFAKILGLLVLATGMTTVMLSYAIKLSTGDRSWITQVHSGGALGTRFPRHAWAKVC